MSPDERHLRGMLGRWQPPDLDQPAGFRFHDAPPDAVRRALATVDPSITASRPDGQPPAGWLVDIAERLGGLLAGQVGDDEDLPERLRVDALCVPAERAAELARAVDADWPDPDRRALPRSPAAAADPDTASSRTMSRPTPAAAPRACTRPSLFCVSDHAALHRGQTITLKDGRRLNADGWVQ